jgi:type I restriction enzyme R subunit
MVINPPKLKRLAFELEKKIQRTRPIYRRVRSEKRRNSLRIIGFIRQAAIGEALVLFETRVDNALEKILASQTWKTPQKQWLRLSPNK